MSVCNVSLNIIMEECQQFRLILNIKVRIHSVCILTVAQTLSRSGLRQLKVQTLRVLSTKY